MVDGLKALDPERPIREAICFSPSEACAYLDHKLDPDEPQGCRLFREQCGFTKGLRKAGLPK